MQSMFSRAIPRNVQGKYFHRTDFKLTTYEKMQTRGMKRLPGGGVGFEVRKCGFKNSTLPNKRDFLELTHDVADARMSIPYDPAQRRDQNASVRPSQKKHKTDHTIFPGEKTTRAKADRADEPPVKIPEEIAACSARLREVFAEVVHGKHVVRKLSRGMCARDKELIRVRNEKSALGEN